MKPKIKNKVILKTIAETAKSGVFDRPVEEAFDSTPSSEEAARLILWGYVYSLLEIADRPDVGADLDLTYGTVKNMTKALAYEFLAGQNFGYTQKENLAIVEKTVAAYLSFLALNEHDAALTVYGVSRPTDADFDDPRRWASLDVKVCLNDKYVDLLDAAHGSASVKNGELTVLLGNVIRSYRDLTGTDLAALGVDDFRLPVG